MTPPTQWFHAANEAELPSPALLIFQERVSSNLKRMLEIAGGPERLRPHVKTHKLGPLIAQQRVLGISKFKCATIAEAELCAAEGAGDVLLAFPAVGPNARRICELARRFPNTRFAAIADSAHGIHGLAGAAREARITLDVLLDLDCGMHRTGVPPGPQAVELYREIHGTNGLRVGGLHAYDGHLHESDCASRQERCDEAFGPVVELRQTLIDSRLPVPALVAGGSPTFPFHAAHPDRELSPGTTVLWDFGYGDAFPELGFLHAAALLTRVISKPGANRLCLDLGHKAIASENPQPRARLLEIPDATAVMHSEEHLVVETLRADEFTVGDALHAIPRHICPTVALHSEAFVVRSGEIAETWPILARARRLTV